jgi:uncharacterized membrane protein (UPF0136 family)
MIEVLARSYLFVFGIATAAGGVVGYVKAKSKASLIAGTVAGGLLLGASALLGSGKSGAILGLVVSAALAGRFGNAFAKTKKPMPAGAMAALGLVGAALSAAALFSKN